MEIKLKSGRNIKVKNITLDERDSLMDSLSYGFDTLGSLCPKATVHRGIYEDNKDSLRLYTIVSGLDIPKKRLQQLAP